MRGVYMGRHLLVFVAFTESACSDLARGFESPRTVNVGAGLPLSTEGPYVDKLLQLALLYKS